jgi:hypothetical protein
MGLDITAYRGLKPAPEAELDEDGYPVDYESYWRTGAGSYGGYNMWRRELAELGGISGDYSQEPPAGAPFAELVWFPDNEGVIGPVVAKKLLKDFQDHFEKAKDTLDNYSFDKYVDWMKAFEFASDNGAVEFH